MTDLYDHIRHVWCSLCDEPHEPCEDELACLDYSDADIVRLNAFHEAEDAAGRDPEVSA